MTKDRFNARTFPAGAVASGIPYTVKLHLDDSTLQNGNTGAAGEVDYAPNLSPGPHYITATDTAPTPDSIRVWSSTSKGSGGAYSLAELPMVLRTMGTGVVDGYLNELAVTYDAAGLDLDVATGAALVLGIPAVVNTAFEHAVATARDATNPKQCYLVLEYTGIGEAEEGKVVAKDVCGAAAASPSLPALTQTEALYQYPLATFRLPNTGSTTLTQVTDARTFVLTRNPVVPAIARRTDPTDEDTTISTTGENVAWVSGVTQPTLIDGVVYDIESQVTVICKVSAGQTVSIAPWIADVANIAPFASSNSTSYITLSNTHTLVGVLGTGALINCNTHIKVSGGTATYITGVQHVMCWPRT